jgi:hypothetical protein
VVHSACRVDVSRLDSSALQMVSELTFAATDVCGLGARTWGSLHRSRPSQPRARAGKVCGHGVHCACRPCGVHGMTHVPALDVRSRVLRENVPGHRLSDCGCVGPTRTLLKVG